MPQFIQGEDGKFAGSIGDGKTRIPTPSDIDAMLDNAKVTPPVDMPAQAYSAYLSLSPSSFNLFSASSVQADPEKAVKVALETFYSMQDDARQHILNEDEFSGSGWVIDTEYDVQGNETYKKARSDDGSIFIIWEKGTVTYVSLSKKQDKDFPIMMRVDKEGKLHDQKGSLNSPAFSSPLLKRYYRHGFIHRSTGPAVIHELGLDGDDWRAAHSWYHGGEFLVTVTSDGTVIREDGTEITGMQRKLLGIRCADLNNLVKLRKENGNV